MAEGCCALALANVEVLLHVRFAYTGAGWVFGPVHAPNNSLSTPTFCCSGFDLLQELQALSTVCTCSIFG